MQAARAECELVVVTLFVNPTQFGPGEDLGAYPRDPEGDAAVAAAEGVDLLFTPSVEEMYPEPGRTTVHVDGLTSGLCGRSRPTHFDGVTTVVAKLFAIVGPSRGVLRAQGRPAARRGPTDGDRPEPAGRGDRLPAGPRARRAGDVEPQRVPHRRRAPRRQRRSHWDCARPRRRSSTANGPRRSSAGSSSRRSHPSRCSPWTTSRSSMRPPSSRCPASRARCWSPWPCTWVGRGSSTTPRSRSPNRLRPNHPNPAASLSTSEGRLRATDPDDVEAPLQDRDRSRPRLRRHVDADNRPTSDLRSLQG